jgi:hypothetical protein
MNIQTHPKIYLFVFAQVFVSLLLLFFFLFSPQVESGSEISSSIKWFQPLPFPYYYYYYYYFKGKVGKIKIKIVEK